MEGDTVFAPFDKDDVYAPLRTNHLKGGGSGDDLFCIFEAVSRHVFHFGREKYDRFVKNFQKWANRSHLEIPTRRVRTWEELKEEMYGGDVAIPRYKYLWER